MENVKGNKLQYIRNDNQHRFKINGQEIKQIIDFKLIVKPQNCATLSLTIDISKLDLDIS
ncbi:hypothetical protein [Senegalia massiliensis]|uniref:Uncharacterized protein n=1 Tax=Senegalia massiliensis TaxID=1720316 RepID=A0A845R050_9CLOT|nr:hypothetical protein [Senegalia massiliensis]NBI08095.1 hypothetical protein [Senegalia massiliensis]